MSNIDTAKQNARKLISQILYESKTDESDMLLLAKLENIMPVPEAVEQKFRPQDFYDGDGKVEIDLFVDVCFEHKLNAVAMLHFMRKYLGEEGRKAALKAMLTDYLENIASYDEEEGDSLIRQMEHLTPNSEITDYIFWPDRHFDHEPTVDEIVERCFAFKPLAL